MLAGDDGTYNGIHIEGDGQGCSQEGIKKRQDGSSGYSVETLFFYSMPDKITYQGEMVLFLVLKFVQG